MEDVPANDRDVQKHKDDQESSGGQCHYWLGIFLMLSAPAGMILGLWIAFWLSHHG